MITTPIGRPSGSQRPGPVRPKPENAGDDGDGRHHPGPLPWPWRTAYGEWKTRIRTEGATYAAFSFVRKVGQAIGGALVGAALGYFGYVSATGGKPSSQSQATLDGIHLTISLLPSVIFLGALLIMTAYPLTEKRHAEIMQEIRARRIPAAAEKAAGEESIR